MAIVDFPQDADPSTNPAGRVGGFYDKLEDIEKAAEYLSFDVVVPPKLKRGYFMVPVSSLKVAKPRD